MLDIYFIHFDKLQHKLSYKCKVLEKYGFFSKTFQSYSFGDQQRTEPLIHRHIHNLIYFNNTFNYGNGPEMISRRCSLHQFNFQKEHKSRMDTRLSSLSHQYEQPQCTLDYCKNSFYHRIEIVAQWKNLMRIGMFRTTIHSGDPCEIVHMSNFYVTVLFNVVK